MTTSTNLDVTFLGTCSAVPTATRNVSALALRYLGDTWLFDCGEGTQHQLLSSSCPLRLSRVSRILITHLHGDHVLGLPGLLCTMGMSGARTTNANAAAQDGASAASAPPPAAALELVGPRGLRNYVRSSLHLTHAGHLAYPLVIHELHDDHDDHDEHDLDHVPAPAFDVPPLACERADLGRDVALDPGTGLWVLPAMACSSLTAATPSASLHVVACPIRHSVTTVGYVVTEPASPGAVNAAVATQRIEANRAALAAQGVTKPLALMAQLKQGKTVTLPDGSRLDPAELVGPAVPGRKVVILGDTFDPQAIGAAAQDADVLIHEATNASVEDGDPPVEKVQQQAVEHGHSTPQMAGRFAASINAKALLLTHFSGRYKGDTEPASLAVMDRIAALARQEFTTGPVVCARDFMTVGIGRNGSISVQ